MDSAVTSSKWPKQITHDEIGYVQINVLSAFIGEKYF